MGYLEKIYTKCKSDGYFNKFKTYSEFIGYFKDISEYRKLWEFLLEKKYRVPDFETFLLKIHNKYQEKKSEKKPEKKMGIYLQPPAAVGDILYDPDSTRFLPDLIKIGELKCDGLDKIPALLPLSNYNGICYLYNNDIQKETANKSIQVLAYRLILSIPKRLSRVLIIDNEKNGMSFSTLFGFDKNIICPDVLDDEHKIQEGINNIKATIPQILSKYLQSKFEDLAEYNRKTKNSNQAFQILLIANFPKGFNKESLESLTKIIENGRRAGIYVLMSFGDKINSSFEFNKNGFKKIMPIINLESNSVLNIPGTEIFSELFYIAKYDDELPYETEKIKNLVNNEINKSDIIELDLESSNTEMWRKDASKGIEVPIGLNQSGEILNFILGHDSNVEHALIGGGTGSGKTILLHNLIINGAHFYRPESLQFLLLDYKQGTEFVIYKDLPHIKILSIESEVQYGISVLEFLEEEIKNRGVLFKEFSAGKLEEYIRASGNVIPRYLLIIDEFQVLLKDNPRATTLLESISRIGRSFGVNIILSTQSLADVDISSSTLSNIGLRIGLKMIEPDCDRILSYGNYLPTSFYRPGQGVFNKQNGLISGNIEFQTAFISKEDIKNRVEKLNLRFQNSSNSFKKYINDRSDFPLYDSSLVIESRENIRNKQYCNIFIGEPAYLQEEHAKIRIRMQSESNVLIVGDDAMAAISILYHSFFQLIKKSTSLSEFYIFDMFDIDSDFHGRMNDLKLISDNMKIYTKEKPLALVLENVKKELDRRIEEETFEDRICIGLLNIKRIRGLRKEDEYNVSALTNLLLEIINDGPEYGIHIFIHLNNNRQLLEIFDSSNVKYFENKIILKGEDPTNYSNEFSIDTIKEQNKALVISPMTKYKIDLVNLYRKLD